MMCWRSRLVVEGENVADSILVLSGGEEREDTIVTEEKRASPKSASGNPRFGDLGCR